MSRVRRVDETQDSRKFSWAGVWNSATTSYYLVVGATVTLVVLGLIMVLSSSSVESLGRGGSAYAIFLRQSMFAVIGTAGMIVASMLKVDFYKKIAWIALIGSFILQILVFVIPAEGGEVYGNRNWIRLGGISIQPSEFMKIAFAVFLGTVISRKLATAQTWLHVIIPTLGGTGLGIGLVMAGNDLGTVLVLCLILAGCYFVAGLPWKWIASFALLGGGLIGVAAIFGGNRLARIMATYDKTCTSADVLCYQVIRGLEGLGTGGFGGVGLGAGSEKWAYLPEAQNDFIFAVLGEELGFLGTSLVIVLFGLLGVGIVRIILRHPDPMVKITTAGIGTWIVGQAMINIGVVTRVLPVIGVPLPFVSAGGSALVAAMIGMGIVVSFAKSEPGAAEAFKAKPSVVRKTIAVISQSGSRVGRRS